MKIHLQSTLIILQNEPGNLKPEISPNNAKYHKQGASILVKSNIGQINIGQINIGQIIGHFNCSNHFNNVRAKL